MLIFFIVEFLTFSLGVAVGIFFRNQITAKIKSALSWGKMKADEVEDRL